MIIPSHVILISFLFNIEYLFLIKIEYLYSGLMHVPESSYTKFMSTIETPREPSQWELNGTAGTTEVLQ